MNLLNLFQRTILNALQIGHHPEHGRSRMYQGTVNRKTLARRRAKNKVARRSRAINRHN